MNIILLERVEHLGQMGDVVHVKSGYARNYLLPQGKAVRATDENRKRFDERRAQLEANNLQRRSEAEAVAAKMAGLSVILIRQAGESGQLYGSVSARDLADAVSEAGFTIGKQQVRLNAPIKSLGLHQVGVTLHPEVIVTIAANVARSVEEAEQQSRTGSAFVRTDEADEEEEELAPPPEEAEAGESDDSVVEPGDEEPPADQ
jgi:ribosomal protein L9